MEINKEIKETEKKLAKLKAKQKEYNLSCLDIQLASLLHDKLCKKNHKDACDWDYGSWEKISYDRKKWLITARKLLRISDFETCTKIIKTLD